jgi:peptide/nickel transport system substrate-binding protein
VLKTAPFNETHWDAYSGYAKFEALYRQALGTVDNKKRAQIIKEMQRMEYNDGGLIIWGFKSLTDGYSAKVAGYKVDRGTLNLNKYGNGFRTIYFV